MIQFWFLNASDHVAAGLEKTGSELEKIKGRERMI